MMFASLLEVAAKVSSVLSLVAFLGALLFWLSLRKKKASVYSTILGANVNDPTAVIAILRLFNDDKDRLEALTRLLEGDREKARGVLQKIGSDIKVEEYIRARERGAN